MSTKLITERLLGNALNYNLLFRISKNYFGMEGPLLNPNVVKYIKKAEIQYSLLQPLYPDTFVYEFNLMNIDDEGIKKAADNDNISYEIEPNTANNIFIKPISNPTLKYNSNINHHFKIYNFDTLLKYIPENNEFICINKGNNSLNLNMHDMKTVKKLYYETNCGISSAITNIPPNIEKLTINADINIKNLKLYKFNELKTLNLIGKVANAHLNKLNLPPSLEYISIINNEQTTYNIYNLENLLYLKEVNIKANKYNILIDNTKNINVNYL